MMELKIIERTDAIIGTNYDDVKAELAGLLAQYENVVVTEDNLGLCKTIKKDLNALQNSINRRRIDIKKEMSAPINEFDEKCKELAKMVEDIIAPIDAGIKEFTALAREEKLAKAQEWVDEITAEKGLTDEQKAKVIIKPEFGNAATTQKSIKDDIAVQCDAIIAAAEAEKQRLEMFMTVIDLENADLQTPMTMDMFARVIETGDDKDMLAAIKRQANTIRTAEAAAKQAAEERAKAKEEAKNDLADEPKVEKVEKVEEAEEVENEATDEGFLVRVFESVELADAVIAVLAENGYFAEVESK